MRFDSLEAWLSWQESLNPRGIELGLDRVRRVLASMDMAKPPFRVITVGGTNGKGSVASYAESILRAAGFRTGRYLSPHILHYNERVAVDGVDADDAALCAAFDAVDHARGDEALTYFEFGTLAAFEVFRRRNIDVAVLEVGLGGRLDAVNVFDADVAVVVSIGLDHVDWLGSRIEDIAREKAGIFRSSRPAIFGSTDMPAAIADEAARVGARLQRLGHDFRAERSGDSWQWVGRDRLVDALPFPPLPGEHQVANAATAIAAVLALEPETGGDALREGLARMHLAGRLQRVAQSPEIIVDVGHNPDAAACIAEFLRAHPRPTRVLLAMLADKDAHGFVRELVPLVEHWYLAGLEGARGQPAAVLSSRLDTLLPDTCLSEYRDVASAAEMALAHCREDERLLVLGSFHTVAEFLVYFEAHSEHSASD